MVTGASTAELAVVLLDARKSVVEQTRRHTYIASILGIPHVVVAVNKMDLAGFAEHRFRAIELEVASLAEQLGAHDVVVIPISALHGDNVVERSELMSWYDGPTLLEHLETVEIAGDRNLEERRFPVQWVIRPMADEWHDYRGYAGQIASGIWRAGDDVVVLPSGRRSRVASVETAEGPLDFGAPPMSVTIRLEDNLDVGRGDLLADPEDPPVAARELNARVCWMSEEPLEQHARLAIKAGTRWSRAVVDEIASVVDMETLGDVPAERMELNDIGVVRLRLAEPLPVDPYERNRAMGAFVLTDEATNDTVAAGMVLSAVGEHTVPLRSPSSPA
jgi:sulfate adenylyltransferase large subunit